MDTQTTKDEWGDGVISAEQARAFAARVPGTTTDERVAMAADLVAFPLECKVRGVFFEGLSRVVAKQTATTMNDLFALACVPPRKIAFSLYPHRDFYRVFFLAARSLYPLVPLAEGMREVARTFYPIFRESIVGSTIGAFIGKDPATLLSRLADAYNLSVPWNEHRVLHSGEYEVTWQCKVEPSHFYKDIFTGIISGAAASHSSRTFSIAVENSRISGAKGEHMFRIKW